MKKVSILALHLGFGGVEKAICNLANILADNYEVEIAVVYKVDDDGAFELNKNVKVNYLSNLKPNKNEFMIALKQFKIFKILKEGLKSTSILYKRRNLMKKYIKSSDADIIISSRILFHDLVGKFAQENVLKIAQEHRHHNNNRNYIKKLLKACRNVNYLMPVSNELAKDYKEAFQNTKVKVKYIRHAVDNYPTKINYQSSGNLIAVSRLSLEKGIIELTDVMNLVHKKNQSIRLEVYGDGKERTKIETKINELGIENVMTLKGFQKKNIINKAFEKSSMFILSSYEESFGLVLIEAMAYGIPCIAFDSAQGAKEVINNKNGILIENRDNKKMANTILEIMQNKEKLNNMSREARKTALAYSFEKVKKEWIDFLSEITE